ncbi:MAG: peptide chain release factor N(5)-glutamine methyltransferase [Phormidesmis sp.]
MPEQISGEALFQWRNWAIQQAQSNQIDPYEVDWLLQGLTDLSSLSLQLGSYRSQSNLDCQVSLTQLTQKWHRRIADSVPVQYLAGETPWREFSITVSPDVLIPRPETELIIEIAQTLATQTPSKSNPDNHHWADLGTGSGAIALGLATTFPTANIHAVDISQQALAIAQGNAKKHNLTDRITFYPGSWLSPLRSLKGKLTGIITNPPYIPTQTVQTLQIEVTKHEPHIALDGGQNGLDAITTLITHSAHYLQPGGIFVTELMAGQAETVASLLKQNGQYTQINIHPDLAGINRFVSARKAL